MKTSVDLSTIGTITHFICHVTECSSEKFVNETTAFPSPKYPQPYPNNLLCRVIFTAPQEMTFLVNFTDFEMADQFDHLTINDGDSKYSRVMAIYNKGFQQKASE